MRSFTVVAAVACAIAFASLTFAQSPHKKLIEFGWDEPDTAFMRKHIAQMETTPFDGTVFHLNFKAGDGSMQNYVWHTWSTRAFKEADFQHAIDDLKNTPFKRFTHNFLRFNTAPANVDWFDDAAYATIASNARLAAKIARDGKAVGILFDIEQYNEPLWTWSKQRDMKTKKYTEYHAQARKRGRQVMEAFQAGYPDLTILMTWSYSLPFQQGEGDAFNMAKAEYGLLRPFLDGMFEAAKGKTKIVDGYESSYSYKTAKQFDDARRLMTQGVPAMLGDAGRERYKQHGAVSFGIWMDYDWRSKGWDEKDFSRNHFSPQEFEASVRKAWETTDQYVWIYTETPKWWTANDGKSEKLPREYDQAVRRALGK